jgi:hypothetical protein
MKLSSTAFAFLVIVGSNLLQQGAEAHLTPANENVRRRAKKEKKGKKKKKKKDTKTNDSSTTIGLALSGGSFPAAIATGGVMRGFQQKKVWVDDKEIPAMDKIDFTSALSGGNFPSILYAYAKDTTSDELLDVDGIIYPNKMTTQELENIPEKSIFNRLVTSLVPSIVIALISAILLGANFWSTAMYFHMLQPMGIGPKEPMNTLRREDAKPTPIATMSMVGPLELWSDYLYFQMFNTFVPVENIMNTRFYQNIEATFSTVAEEAYNGTFSMLPDVSYMWQMASKSDFQIPVYAYVTPDEFNIPMYKHHMKFDPIVNMTTAEPVNFEPVFAKPNDVQPESEGPFTVTKALAASTNAVAIFADIFPPELEQLKTIVNGPITINIPTADDDHQEMEPSSINDIPRVDDNHREMVVSDGGYNDGTGIPALVQKKVRKIICTPFSSGNESLFQNQASLSAINVGSFFGVSIGDGPADLRNHMFDLNSNGEDQFDKLFYNIQSLYEAGEPMITTLKDLDVIENPFYGIEGGYKVDLTFIFLFGVPKKFAETLPDDIAPPPAGMNKTNEFGYFTNPDFSTVPNMFTTTPTSKINIPELGLDLDLPIPDFAQETKATKMSYTLTSWMVTHAWDGLWGADGEMKFEGFAEIFE